MLQHLRVEMLFYFVLLSFNFCFLHSLLLLLKDVITVHPATESKSTYHYLILFAIIGTNRNSSSPLPDTLKHRLWLKMHQHQTQSAQIDLGLIILRVIR